MYGFTSYHVPLANDSASSRIHESFFPKLHIRDSQLDSWPDWWARLLIRMVEPHESRGGRSTAQISTMPWHARR